MVPQGSGTRLCMGAVRSRLHLHQWRRRPRRTTPRRAKWYRKAAEQDEALAQRNLASMYEDGRGVPRNYVLAHMWLNLAAAHSRTDFAAMRNNAGVMYEMTKIGREGSRPTGREDDPRTDHRGAAAGAGVEADEVGARPAHHAPPI